MIIQYATKRDQNGNRYYLCVDHDRKEFATTPRHWYCREDFIEINKSDRRKIIEWLTAAGYTERYTLQ